MHHRPDVVSILTIFPDSLPCTQCTPHTMSAVILLLAVKIIEINLITSVICLIITPAHTDLGGSSKQNLHLQLPKSVKSVKSVKSSNGSPSSCYNDQYNYCDINEKLCKSVPAPSVWPEESKEHHSLLHSTANIIVSWSSGTLPASCDPTQSTPALFSLISSVKLNTRTHCKWLVDWLYNIGFLCWQGRRRFL